MMLFTILFATFFALSQAQHLVEMDMPEFTLELAVYDTQNTRNPAYQRHMEDVLTEHFSTVLPTDNDLKSLVTLGNLHEVTVDTKLARTYFGQNTKASTIQVTVEGTVSFRPSFHLDDHILETAQAQLQQSISKAFKGENFIHFAELVENDDVLRISTDVSIFVNEVRVAKGVLKDGKVETEEWSDSSAEEETRLIGVHLIAAAVLVAAIAAFISCCLVCLSLKKRRQMKQRKQSKRSKAVEADLENDHDNNFVDSMADAITSIPVSLNASSTNSSTNKMYFPPAECFQKHNQSCSVQHGNDEDLLGFNEQSFDGIDLGAPIDPEEGSESESEYQLRMQNGDVVLM